MKNLARSLVAGAIAFVVLGSIGLGQVLAAGIEVTASDGKPGDSFGSHVAISGDTAVVGAPFTDEFGFTSGSAYVFVRTPAGWCEQAKLLRPDGAAGDWFGSVAISGDTVVVGAPGSSVAGIRSGSAYVFVRTGASWSLQAKLTASDAALGFGYTVAISHDTVVVGAPSFTSQFTAVYVFVRTGSNWSEQVRLAGSDVSPGDYYGKSVAVFGDTVVVGAPHDDGAFEDSGSAYVFYRTGTSWSEQAKLTASGAWPFAKFGKSVSISGDTAAIGGGGAAPGAWVFGRTAASWGERAELIPGDAEYGDYYGWSISIAGDDVVVGSPGDNDHAGNSGSAYLFRRTGASWIERAKLVPSYGSFKDFVGVSVSVSGGFPLVGAERFADKSGSAFVFSQVEYTTYCTPAQPNSTGNPASMTASGSPMLAENYLNLKITRLPPFQIAKLLTSRSQASIPVGSGTLCLGPQQHRFNPLHHSGASGSLSLWPNLIGNLPPTLGAVHSGETWNWQLWYRDTGSVSNFTDAIEITLR